MNATDALLDYENLRAERDQLRDMLERDGLQAEAAHAAMVAAQDERDQLRAYAELLAEALTKVTERGPYSVNGGMACATCTTFWHADPVVTKWQTEHHYNGCAYVIARDALAKNPNPAGVGSSVVSAAEGHEPGSGDSTPHTARNCGTGLACTMDRESGASHPVGEGYEGRNVHELDLLAAVSAVLRQDDSTAEGSLQKALGHLQAVLFDYETVDARSRHQSCTKSETPLHRLEAHAAYSAVIGRDGFMVDGVKWVREDSPHQVGRDVTDAMAERFCELVNWHPDGVQSKVVEGQWHDVTFRDLGKGYIRAALEASQFVACNKQSEPDPLGEALNSGDGSYKP